MKRYSVNVGAVSEWGGDYYLVKSFDTVEEAKECFKETVEHEKENIKNWILKKNEYLQVIIQDNENEIESWIDSEKIYR